MPRQYRRRPRPATWRRTRRTGGGPYAQRRWTREEEDLLIQTWNSRDNWTIKPYSKNSIVLLKDNDLNQDRKGLYIPSSTRCSMKIESIEQGTLIKVEDLIIL